MYSPRTKSQRREVLLWPTRDYWVNPTTGQVHFEGCSHPPEKYEEYMGRHISLADAVQSPRGLAYDADPCAWCLRRERQMRRKGRMNPFRAVLRRTGRIRRRSKPNQP